MENKIKVKPFVKWVGGKTQLLPEIRKRYQTQIDKYCEPFVGGGAVLFDVLSTFYPKEVLINDINAELINTYIQIKENVDDLITSLDQIQMIYYGKSTVTQEEFYYECRNRFNTLKSCDGNELEKATLFIFLNKTCFNGLYRENHKGCFNASFGRNTKPLICDRDNLLEIHSLLSNTTITAASYESCLDFIDNDTFVYIDSPYRPLSKTASFRSYNQTGFGDEDQVKLRGFVSKVVEKGADVLISNSDPHVTTPSDDFFDDLYNEYVIERVSACRKVNSDSSKRGKINELLIRTYALESDNIIDPCAGSGRFMGEILKHVA